ncbi:MAG: tetratricopeptide repeat protein [Bryobacteraceae bacterium]|jgi:tetratricopeptide (TPR) repeat protein|nr:tetratricopeptide repeat protein [Bryobacteraceae bacterium]
MRRWLWVVAVSAAGALAQAPGHKSAREGFHLLAERAAKAREEGRLEEAVAAYRQALRQRPSWTEGLWYLGATLYELDRYAEAREPFRRLLALQPKAGPAHALLGLCLYQTGDYELALAHLRRARALGFVGNAQLERVALYHLALLLSKYEHFEESLFVLAGLAQQGLESAALVEAAGIAALRRPLLPPEVPAADRELVRLAGRAAYAAGGRRPHEAEQAFRELLARYPSAANVHYLYGSFLLSSRPEEAVKELVRELEISPSHLPALVALALELQKQGRSQEGLRYARQAAAAFPNSFAAQNALGRLLVDTGALEEGIAALERARELAPDSLQTRFALSSAYAKAGRKQDAERERREFLRLRKLSGGSGEPQ